MHAVVFAFCARRLVRDPLTLPERCNHHFQHLCGHVIIALFLIYMLQCVCCYLSGPLGANLGLQYCPPILKRRVSMQTYVLCCLKHRLAAAYVWCVLPAVAVVFLWQLALCFYLRVSPRTIYVREPVGQSRVAAGAMIHKQHITPNTKPNTLNPKRWSSPRERDLLQSGASIPASLLIWRRGASAATRKLDH